MTKALVSAIAFFALCAAAQATLSSVPRHATSVAPAHKYWLSDGLNRLVFWQPQTVSHSDQPAR